MYKLKMLSTIMVTLGIILLLAGIIASMKELMEYGLCLGVAGIIGYAIIFIARSTSFADQKSISD